MRDGGPGALGRRRSAEWKSREMTMPGNDKAGGAGSDDLTIRDVRARLVEVPMRFALGTSADVVRVAPLLLVDLQTEEGITGHRSEEHTSDLQSLMRISYAVFCLKKNKHKT